MRIVFFFLNSYWTKAHEKSKRNNTFLNGLIKAIKAYLSCVLDNIPYKHRNLEVDQKKEMYMFMHFI